MSGNHFCPIVATTFKRYSDITDVLSLATWVTDVMRTFFCAKPNINGDAYHVYSAQSCMCSLIKREENTLFILQIPLFSARQSKSSFLRYGEHPSILFQTIRLAYWCIWHNTPGLPILQILYWNILSLDTIVIA